MCFERLIPKGKRTALCTLHILDLDFFSEDVKGMKKGKQCGPPPMVGSWVQLKSKRSSGLSHFTSENSKQREGGTFDIADYIISRSRTSFYLAAIVWQKHMSSRNPIQLKRKAVRKAVKKTKSFPRSCWCEPAPNPASPSPREPSSKSSYSLKIHENICSCRQIFVVGITEI